MAVSAEVVDIEGGNVPIGRRVVESETVLGNGIVREIADVVFVRRDRFDPLRSRIVAREIAELNAALVEERHPYLLIGFGRWGSSDPSLGIPIDWASISGARAIVETTVPGLNVEPSQGSHFFHNLSSAGVLYFNLRPHVDPPIDWEWIEALPVVRETAHVRHVRAPAPLEARVDGRTGRGVIARGVAES
jgi:hypothetical protein